MPCFRFAIGIVVLAWALPACGGGQGDACTDLDRDGFGDGCEAGPDCDDANPLRTGDCDAVPPPDCETDPMAPGCPCLRDAVEACYPAAEQTRDVGLCRAGARRCVGGHWGLCEDAVVPGPERCNERDDDCDGTVDEGALSPCGGCAPDCTGAVWGQQAVPFEPGEDTAVTARGALTLARPRREASSVWVANTLDATVSRIDARAARETARYRSGGESPRRVAVDYNGDAWVVNADEEGPSVVRRIAGHLERCTDRDASGSIDTSTGPDDLRDPGADECVLQTLDVGGPGEGARAIAIDGERGEDGAGGGNPWVGLHDGMAVVRIDGRTGETLARIPTPGFRPFDATFDPLGRLWLASRDGQLARIDRRPPIDAEILEVPLACYLLYGIAAAADGRLVVTGQSCDQIALYDPQSRRWDVLPTSPSPRGVALGETHAWVTHTEGRLSRVSLSPLALESEVDLWAMGLRPIDSIGVAADGRGALWVVSSRARAGGEGIASRLDVESESVTTHLRVGRGPRVQGDLTGQRLQGPYAERGTARRVFGGCADGPTRWHRVHLDAEPGLEGRVEVSLRHAPDREGLETADYGAVGALPDDTPPFDLDLPDGGVVELKLTLRTEALDSAPQVHRVGLEWSCPGPI